MKNIIKKFLGGLYIILVIFLWIYFFNFLNVGKWNDDHNENDYIDGSVEQWWQLATWINSEDIAKLLDNNISEDELLYSEYINSWNYASFIPASQKKMEWDYATKTEMMNKYLADNTFHFDFPQNAQKWYLYIRLDKPSNEWIFLFWYWSDKNWHKVSWNLDSSKNLILNSDTEFLYNLEKIDYIKYYDKTPDTYNWLNELRQGNSNYIAWFLRVYDWSNKVEQITIARE